MVLRDGRRRLHEILQLPGTIQIRLSRKDNCTARGNRHAILPSRATPPGVSKNPDGRSPGSRVSAPLRLPGPKSGQWLAGCRSPLTVAGAATVSVPIGYASPCSHFIRRVVRLGETIGQQLMRLRGAAATPLATGSGLSATRPPLPIRAPP